MRSISSKIRKKTGVCTLITIIQHSFASLGMAIREEKEKESRWKSNIITSLFADNMILYIENPKTTTRKLLELINEFINELQNARIIHINLIFQYTSNEKLENVKKHFFYCCIKMNKIPKAKDLYTKNYKTVKKEI